MNELEYLTVLQLPAFLNRWVLQEQEKVASLCLSTQFIHIPGRGILWSDC